MDVGLLKRERAALLRDAAQRAEAFLRSLDERRVRPAPEALAALRGLRRELPARPTSAANVLAELDAVGSPSAMASSGGRFFGFVIGAALPVSVAANWLATAWDQNANMEVVAPGACALESVAARWLVEVLGFPDGTHCSLTTGTTTADITALVAARHSVLARCGWDVERRGLAGSPPVTVVVGEEVHATMLRALAVVGFGRDQIRFVPVDERGRMRVEALPEIAGPTIVCVQAGNVNTGAFDPIAEVCERVRPEGAWVHLDGAFGLWAAASPGRRHLVAGVERVDSAASDAHKWLNTPYDCGLAFVRDRDALGIALGMSADYLVQNPGDPMKTTLEASRRARGVEVWAALQALGREGLEALVDGCCELAQRFAGGLRQAGFDVLNEVELNQVLVRFGDDERTRRVVAAVQEEGTCWCSGTTWQGKAAMRISVSSWATTAEDVDRSLEAIRRCAVAP